MEGIDSNQKSDDRSVRDVSLEEHPVVDTAPREAASFKEKNLDEDAKQRSHDRREGTKLHAYIVGILLLWLVAIVLICMIGVWGYHLLTPAKIHFLSVEQFNDLQTIVTSATVAALASEFVRRLL